MDDDHDLRGLGARLRVLRQERDMTLAAASRATGMSSSTLSRLEGGHRRATLELIAPLARVYDVSLDELVRGAGMGKTRGAQRSFVKDGMTLLPLARDILGVQAYKAIIPGRSAADAVAREQRVHDGHAWLYVLRGRLRLVLGMRDVVLVAGEAAEYETRVPHAIENLDATPVEIVGLFGATVEPVRVRARTVR